MNLRQLKKQDKRAAAILIALHTRSVDPANFCVEDDGRYCYWWRCSYEYNEWDCLPALEFLEQQESNEHMGECIDANGDFLPESYWPKAISSMNKLPSGYRWRGRRVVPVDKTGAMVRTAAQRAQQREGQPAPRKHHDPMHL